jgi:membrane peptidoglycan carboxypeptidase
MQLARNLFLSHERSVSRKLREIELAQEIEKRYSKDEILLLYLNTVYFGSGNYGVWTAAREYFSKAPADLSITESATLVGLLQSPEGYNPLRHPEKALRRRNQVLRNLLDVGRLSQKEFDRERRLPLGLNRGRASGDMPRNMPAAKPNASSPASPLAGRRSVPHRHHHRCGPASRGRPRGGGAVEGIARGHERRADRPGLCRSG